jgi:hypothetical protein
MKQMSNSPGPTARQRFGQHERVILSDGIGLPPRIRERPRGAHRARAMGFTTSFEAGMDDVRAVMDACCELPDNLSCCVRCSPSGC